MIKTLLFVHGTGVREEGMTETLDSLRKGFNKAGQFNINLQAVPWYEEATKVGVDAIAEILPPAAHRAVDGPPSAEELAAAEWSNLLDDPLFELRIIAVRQSKKPADGGIILPGGAIPPAIQITDWLNEAQQKLAEPLPGEMPLAATIKALKWVKETPELRAAAIAVDDASDEDFRLAVARSIVAKALADVRRGTGEGPDALYVSGDRDALVEHILTLIGPRTKGLGNWLFDKVKGFATAQATSYGVKRRDDLMIAISRGVGDILLYQRRGDAILKIIEDKILELGKDEPIVVLGHSLGGVMLVDLLSRPRPEGPLPVSKLITVASQSTMFLKCDALGTMRLTGDRPEGTPFRPWLNFYDRNDFLSFCVERTFPGLGDKVKDEEIKSGVPFPDSHGAYFRTRDLYEKIVAWA